MTLPFPSGPRALVLCLLAIGWGWAAPIRADEPSQAESLSVSFRKAIRKVSPAVVTVRVPTADVDVPPGLVDATPFLPAPGMPPVLPSPYREGGSGVIIDAAKGFVLTNDHVVPSLPGLTVTLHDGRQRTVREVRRDPKSDLAVLRIDPEGLTAAAWGDSSALEVGDWVLAIGQPFGLSGTVTAGIVSGTGRGIGLALYEDLIQTDAAINPGNSGGPLVNLQGEIIGINTAIKTSRGGYEGVGFAVPAVRAQRVARELIENGRVRRAYLGINVRRVDPAAGERLGHSGSVVVTGVARNSPAEEAGLRPGDVVIGIGNDRVVGTGMLQASIEIAAPGEPLRLELIRRERVTTLTVRPQVQPDGLGLAPPAAPIPTPEPAPPVAAQPGPEAVFAPVPERPEPILSPQPAPGPTLLDPGARAPTRFRELGLRLAEPNPDLVRRFRLSEPVAGVVVVGIEPDGPGDRGGLELGMVLTDVGERRVTSLSEVRAALGRRSGGRDLVVRMLKGSKAEFRVLVGVGANSEAVPIPTPSPAPANAPAVAPPPAAEPAPLDPPAPIETSRRVRPDF